MTGGRPRRADRQTLRLEALKADIERGEYRVPAEQVADAVLLWYRRMEPGQSDVSSSTSS
jgi:anti-sigma28 factor (negative regulator of flagellin synthesis)